MTLPSGCRPARVSAHAGYRGEEEPRAVRLEGRWREVAEIVARWRDPSGRWFRVRTAEGAELTLLCADPDLDWWALAGAGPHHSG